MPQAAFLESARSLLGPSGIITDKEEAEPYLWDFWRQNLGVSPAVLRPSSTAEVSSVVRLAGEHGVPLVPQSGNTGLVTGGIPDRSGRQVVLSLERMNRIRDRDPAGDYIVVEAGCVLADIQQAAQDMDRLFPLSLGAQGSCRIGGNISTNAGGVNVLRYGMTRQLVMGLEVVLGDGTIWNGLRALKKDNTGYDLKQVFIGAEGTLGIITAAVLRLFPRPRETQTLWLAIERPAVAIELLKRFQSTFGELITSFELLTGFGVEAAATHLPGVRHPIESRSDWHLLIEVEWSLTEGLLPRIESIVEEIFEAGLASDGTIALSEEQRAMMWRIREGQSEATRHMGYIVRSDVSVKVRDLPLLIDRATARFAESAPGVTLIPFGHVGDGNLHFNMIAPEDTDDMPALKKRLLAELADMVFELDGSFSAEHGIGRSKRDELVQRKSEVEVSMMRQLKSTFDPANILNPGAVLR
ncbi:MAG: FAD-binding oxidoreductase [Geminicoccaceae bacterium]|nr:FAD-binding oxidoreductase [Geminicoccaceae bacterium]MCB9942868.1 FAD-binding oxidoreductase [Geminicoccaceae bacterium]